jgi:hypothetical protein
MSGDDAQGPSSLQERTQAFLAEFFIKGEELVRDLIDENERLRAAAKTRPSGSDTAALVGRLMKQIETLEAECSEIRKLAGSVERASGGYRDRLDALEQEHYHLAAMYVAGGQFQRAGTIDEVLRTITEILLNFVGVGRFTVLAVDEERQTMFPLLREGGPIDGNEEIRLPGSAALADAVSLGGPWKAGHPVFSGDGVLMYLPLSSGTRLVAVIRIENFLPQKGSFNDNDFGLLELISEQSGIAIETAWIRAHAKVVPLARRALGSSRLHDRV